MPKPYFEKGKYSLRSSKQGQARQRSFGTFDKSCSYIAFLLAGHGGVMFGSVLRWVLTIGKSVGGDGCFGPMGPDLVGFGIDQLPSDPGDSQVQGMYIKSP